MNSDFADITIFVIGLGLSAFFSGAEAALISISAKRVKQLIEEGGNKARAFTFLAEKPSEVLTLILIGNNLVNISVASVATTLAQRHFANDAISLSVGVTTLMVLIFGEIVPKTFARNHSEKLAIGVLSILRVLYYVAWPLVKIFMLVIKAVLGKNTQLSDRLVTKDDIEFLVNEAEKERTIDSKQIDMLNSILEFPTIKVKDIMVPRTQVHGIKKNATFEEIVNLVKEVAHSRYPVYRDNLDNTLGFLHVKDLSVIAPAERAKFDVTKYINPPFFVYEHMKIQAVFDHMNRKKVHLALVRDENGVVVGIVSLEDIIEEIFGEIQDEHDDEEDGIPDAEHDPLSGGITLPASINLRDLDYEYDVELPTSDNYSTLNGFLLDMLGNSFPIQGNILFWGGYKFTLEKVKDNIIEEVKIEPTSSDNPIRGESEDNMVSSNLDQGLSAK